MQETIKNLAKAFIGESQARNRYTYYAKQAKKDGYEQVAAIFEETAEQEREHAKWLMRMLNDLKKDSSENLDEVQVETGMPTIFGTTEENLQTAINGENYEHTSMYPEFADKAQEEGLGQVAVRLKSIARAEAHHEERYQKLLDNLKAGTTFKKEEEISWVCRKCGYEHKGVEAPGECPACGHPQAYYQVKSENY